MDLDRRAILKGAAAAAAAVAARLVGRAAAITPSCRDGSLADIDHIIVFMQENRAFDHYFGMLDGVRGFGDPRPLPLATGRTVWAQPSTEHADGYVLPYHGDSTISRSFTVHGSGQSHQDNIGILNRGRWDGWGETGELHKRMLRYGPGDLPFYYALADAFTICDAYHCSTLTQTYPNRLHLFTGCNGGGTVGGDPEMENYGEDETPSADMATDRPLADGRYQWTTYAERLQAAGISWKVYQEYDNFGDNLLSVFPAFRPCDRSSALYERGRAWVSEGVGGADRTRSDGEQLVAAFRRDLADGTLPSVSWIVTAAKLSEHPDAEPARGEHVCAKLVEALVDHPETFARTAFIINYDEPGGFYDHVPPPVPPVGTYRGHSTVPLDGETKIWASGADVRHTGEHPIGLGARVPAIIVSPFARGGYVCSELFDHTSVIRLIERRFGVREPNISAWRRSICGDLTSAFDFTCRNSTQPVSLPSTDDFASRIARSAAGNASSIPIIQAPATQMEGRRKLRPTPYRLEVKGERVPAGLRLEFTNRGTAGAAFSVHSVASVEEPLHFTIGAGDHHSGVVPSPAGRYQFSVRGPNGLVQDYEGAEGESVAEAVIEHRPARHAIDLTLMNFGHERMIFVCEVAATYAGDRDRHRRIAVEPGQTALSSFVVAASDDWYDLKIRTNGNPSWLRRFSGKVETGLEGLTDPGIGSMRIEHARNESAVPLVT